MPVLAPEVQNGHAANLLVRFPYWNTTHKMWLNLLDKWKEKEECNVKVSVHEESVKDYKGSGKKIEVGVGWGSVFIKLWVQFPTHIPWRMRRQLVAHYFYRDLYNSITFQEGSLWINPIWHCGPRDGKTCFLWGKIVLTICLLKNSIGVETINCVTALQPLCLQDFW